MEVRYLSKNPHKIKEVQDILEPLGISVISREVAIEELQTNDIEKLVTDKVLKAFDVVGRPVLVDHSGIELQGLGGIPGALTQEFWDSLHDQEQERCIAFTKLVTGLGNERIKAITVIGYCDGMRIHTFRGENTGTVPKFPRGKFGFQWDPVFVPDGEDMTYAEMGERKNEISMRRLALEAFSAFMNKHSQQ